MCSPKRKNNQFQIKAVNQSIKAVNQYFIRSNPFKNNSFNRTQHFNKNLMQDWFKFHCLKVAYFLTNQICLFVSYSTNQIRSNTHTDDKHMTDRLSILINVDYSNRTNVIALIRYNHTYHRRWTNLWSKNLSKCPK